MHIHKGDGGFQAQSWSSARTPEQRRAHARLRDRRTPSCHGDARCPRVLLPERPHGGIRRRRDSRATDRNVCSIPLAWVVAVDLKGTTEPNATGTAVSASARTPAWSATGSTLRTSPFRPPRPTFIAAPPRTNGPVVVPFTTRRRRRERRADASPVAANPDRRDHRQPSGLLRQRPHHGASRRRDPRPTRLGPNSRIGPVVGRKLRVPRRACRPKGPPSVAHNPHRLPTQPS